jgi:lipopolysaccharide export system protein LptA
MRCHKRCHNVLLGRVGHFLVAVAGLLSVAAYAERSDRNKPLAFEADRSYKLTEKDGSESQVLEGNVIITQGTMRINASKLTLRQASSGLRFGEGLGTPAFFTQKQDGRNDFFEAYGERIEFDERTDNVKLFTNAKLKIGKDELTAEYIVYNTVTEKYEIAGSAPGAAPQEKPGRVNGIIYPRTKDAQAANPSRAEPAPVN